jgi:hypothetical protein
VVRIEEYRKEKGRTGMEKMSAKEALLLCAAFLLLDAESNVAAIIIVTQET